MGSVEWCLYMSMAGLVLALFVYVLCQTIRVMVKRSEVRSNLGLWALYSIINLNLLCSAVVFVFVYAENEEYILFDMIFDTCMHATLRLTLYLTLLRFVESMHLLKLHRTPQNCLIVTCSLALTLDLIGLILSNGLASVKGLKDLYYIASSAMSLTMLALILGIFTRLWRRRMKTWFCRYNRLFTAFVVSEIIGQLLNLLAALLWHWNSALTQVIMLAFWCAFAEVLPAIFIIAMITPKPRSSSTSLGSYDSVPTQYSPHFTSMALSAIR